MAVPTMTNNAPNPGHITWGAFNIQYNGVSYAIGSGSTSARWVWWRYNGGSSVIEAGADIPGDLTDDDLVLFGNKNGIGVRVQATNLIDGELLVDGSIFADALSVNLINSNHIVTAGLSAAVIKFGTMSGDRISVNTINSDHVVTAGLSAGVIKFGTMSGDRITANTIATSHIVTAGLDAASIKFGTMSGDRIAVNTLNADRITANTLQAAIVNAGAINGITITGSAIRTAASGSRVEMGTNSIVPGSPSPLNSVAFYAGVANELPGGIYAGTTNGRPIFNIQSGGAQNGHISGIVLSSHPTDINAAQLTFFGGSSAFQLGTYTDPDGNTQNVDFRMDKTAFLVTNPYISLTTNKGEARIDVPWRIYNETWKAITPSSPWSIPSGQEPMYRKDAAGNVNMRGAVNRNTGANGNVVFTLPLGFRPINKSAYAVVRTNVVGTFATMEINTAGNVIFSFTPTTLASFGIEINFSTLNN